MKTFIQLISLGLLILGFESCTKEKGNIPKPKFVTTDSIININNSLYSGIIITYSGSIRNIIQAKCSFCHHAGTASNLTNYTILKAKIDDGSFENRVFIEKDMPPSIPLSESDVEKIRCWIDSGAPNN